jgi:hypothetical protein
MQRPELRLRALQPEGMNMPLHHSILPDTADLPSRGVLYERAPRADRQLGSSNSIPGPTPGGTTTP